MALKQGTTWRRRFPKTALLHLDVYTNGMLYELNLHEGKAGNSIERTSQLSLRTLEFRRIRTKH